MLRPGQAIALCVLALLTIGVVMVNSAGMSVNPKAIVTFESILLSRSSAYMLAAMVAMFVCALLPVRRLIPAHLRGTINAPASPAPAAVEPPLLGTGFLAGLARHYLRLWPMWVGVVGLILVMGLVYVPGVGREVNGSHRWISLPLPGLESFQPSEIAKWALVVLIAWYGAEHARAMPRFFKGLAPGLAAAGVVAGFIVLEDLGTGALLGMVACVLLIAAGARVWQMALISPLPLALVAFAIFSSQYRRDRILAFLDPYADAQRTGFHMIQSMVAVANGQFFGRGLGHGLQKFGYLPEDTTDFLFAIVCEELGVAGAALVVSLYGALIWCVWTVVRRERCTLLKLLGLGVMSTVGFQTLINLAVVTGLGPTKGIALPLLSSGGTGWILTAASLGLVVAMDRTQQSLRVAAEPDEDVAEGEPEPEADADPVIQTRRPTPDHDFAPRPAVAFATAAPALDTFELAEPSDAAPEPADTVPGQTGLLFADDPAATVAEETAAEEESVEDDTDEAAPSGEQAEAEAADAPATPPVIVTPKGRDWMGPAQVNPA